MDPPSAWAHGPERPLNDAIKKERLTIYDDEATFYPDMVSNEVLRDQVQSSGYGYTTPGVDPVDGTPLVPESSIRIMEELDEACTFRPELVASPIAKSLRKQVPSSGYGRRLPSQWLKDQKENEARRQELVGSDGKPLFIPRVPAAKGTKKKKKIGAPACARVVPKKKVEVAPLPSFKPVIPKSKFRDMYKKQTASSGYRKKTAKEWDEAPASDKFYNKNFVYTKTSTGEVVKTVQGKRPELSEAERPMQRYTLLVDKTAKPTFRDEYVPPDGSKFVLDCVDVAHQDVLYSKHVKHTSPLKEYTAMTDELKGLTRSDALGATGGSQYADISSSGYGAKTEKEWEEASDKFYTKAKKFVEEDGVIKPLDVDPVADRFDREEAREAAAAATGQWAVTKKGTYADLTDYELQGEAEEILELSKAKMESTMGEVASSGYGKVMPQPRVKQFYEQDGVVKQKMVPVEKKEPELLQGFLTPRAKCAVLPSPEPFNNETNKWYKKRVESHAYGKHTPPVIERPYRAPAPVWLPSSNKADVPEPEPAPHNKLTLQVLSHYAEGAYDAEDPGGTYYDDEAQEDDVDGEVAEEEEEFDSGEEELASGDDGDPEYNAAELAGEDEDDGDPEYDEAELAGEDNDEFDPMAAGDGDDVDEEEDIY